MPTASFDPKTPPKRLWVDGYGWISKPEKLSKSATPAEQAVHREESWRWKQALRQSTWGFEKRQHDKAQLSRTRSIGAHRRRSREKDAFVEDVDPIVVFERDKWICQLCQHPVSKLRDKNLVDIASLDHIIPISRGGAHSYANTQLAHLSCNIRKGASTPKK